MNSQQESEAIKIPKPALLFAIVILAALVVFVIVNLSKAEQFALLLTRAQPRWLVLAFVLQIVTYLCAAWILDIVIRAGRRRVPLSALAQLSIERLSVDQLIPAGGVAGNVAVLQMMRQLGLPDWLATEALLIDLLSHYISYAAVTITAVFMLGVHHSITALIRYVLAVFAGFTILVPSVIVWLLSHKDRQLPSRLLRFGPIASITKTIQSASTERVYSPRLLGITSVLGVLIFLLDAGTLWAMMEVAGNPVSISTAFVAIVIASVAGSISLLPGGIGGFEAGAIIILTSSGVPVEAALAGTLLLRGLTLWLPLIPGLILVRHMVKLHK